MKYKILLSVFIVGLLISTVTALPINNTKSIKVNDNKDLESFVYDKLLNKYDLSKFESLKYKYLDFRGIDSLIGGDEIIEECNKYYNDVDVRTAVSLGNQELISFINDNESLNKLFEIDNTFNLDNIYDRILTLRPMTVLYDIKDLLKVETNYKDFNNTRSEYCIRIFEYLEPYAYNETTLKDNSTNLYPIVDEICRIISTISLLWAVPLILLGGLIGMYIASMVTYVFFAPVTIPMSIYVAIAEGITNGNDIADDLVAFAIMGGLVGLIIWGLPLMFNAMFLQPMGLYGITYVIEKLAIINIIQNKGDYTLITDENPPRVADVNYDKPVFQNKPVEFRIRCFDKDVMIWDNKESKRDFLIIGIDWNNDMVFDEWSNFEKYDSDYTNFYILHSFGNKGSNTINIICFDLMGGYSEVYSYTINVFKNDRSFYWDFPLLYLLYCKMTFLHENYL